MDQAEAGRVGSAASQPRSPRGEASSPARGGGEFPSFGRADPHRAGSQAPLGGWGGEFWIPRAQAELSREFSRPGHPFEAGGGGREVERGLWRPRPARVPAIAACDPATPFRLLRAGSAPPGGHVHRGSLRAAPAPVASDFNPPQSFQARLPVALAQVRSFHSPRCPGTLGARDRLGGFGESPPAPSSGTCPPLPRV